MTRSKTYRRLIARGRRSSPLPPTIIITITIKDYYEHYLYNYLFIIVLCCGEWRRPNPAPVLDIVSRSGERWTMDTCLIEMHSLSLFFVDSILLFNTKNISTKGVSNTCVTYSTYLATKMFLVSRKIFCVIDCDRL